MAVLDRSADALRRRATHLRRLARLIDHAELWDVGLRSDDATWVGPTASAFRDDLLHSCGDVRRAHDELLAGAVRLDRAADAAELAARAALALPTVPAPR